MVVFWPTIEGSVVMLWVVALGVAKFFWTTQKFGIYFVPTRHLQVPWRFHWGSSYFYIFSDKFKAMADTRVMAAGPSCQSVKVRVAGAWSGTLEVPLDEWTVGQLQSEVSRQSGIAIDAMKLICAGKILKGNTPTGSSKSLREAGIGVNSKLLLTRVTSAQQPNAANLEQERVERLTRIKWATKLHIHYLYPVSNNVWLVTSPVKHHWTIACFVFVFFFFLFPWTVVVQFLTSWRRFSTPEAFGFGKWIDKSVADFIFSCNRTNSFPAKSASTRRKFPPDEGALQFLLSISSLLGWVTPWNDSWVHDSRWLSEVSSPPVVTWTQTNCSYRRYRPCKTSN